MDKNAIQAIIPELLEIAEAAGEAILEVYRTVIAVEYKGDNSPVTAADMAAHHIIMDGLTRLTPDTPILSEEAANIPWSTRQQWQRYWLVDPLDGTREFLNRSGEFTVNIALIEGGQPILGVVSVPVTGDYYWGGEATGAWHRGSVGTVRELKVSAPASKLRVLASKSHLNEETRAYIDKLGPVELVQAGSSLKICRIAEGKADLYPRLGPTSEWDTAAAHAVLLGAGGRISTVKGDPLLYNQEETLLNPHFIARFQ
ncbi:3'(2'),5'-bisphosphate nucleotidase CysQ [Hydrocarboniclastica marina]|uniref:3'(2'),5'-bisphosphate nucleotidase CysQ n=1 Tax=Hydrocarboniclastica marina TaxID=2259620 RepID=A0A4P7XIV6_9ALTE|nr:3'(2'),5'-bisphosphate nucleotidase CysQ [Hydrocarboniclastica marina]MAM00612.1 3'(2'),5'-bisphosphate nucleotidase [Alteromonadaceae bacterium]QCF26474.1 3'(2'),5'-bisphosphate nucleotidase [Hydrocarboniclastica marina]